MHNRLNKEEIKELNKYRFTEKQSDSLLSFSSEDLLNEQKRKKIIEGIAERLQAPNKMVASSLLIKRLGFLPVIGLFAMSKWNKKLDLSLGNVFIETDDTNEIWLPDFRLNVLTYKNIEENREAFRKKICSAIFAQHLYPIIDTITKETKLSKMIMLENLAVYIFWMYEGLIDSEQNEKIKARLKEDFLYVVRDADGEIFGPYKQNPINRCFNEKSYVEEKDEEIRYRNTCCFSYMLVGSAGKRCKTCPQLCRPVKKINKDDENEF